MVDGIRITYVTIGMYHVVTNSVALEYHVRQHEAALCKRRMTYIY